MIVVPAEEFNKDGRATYDACLVLTDHFEIRLESSNQDDKDRIICRGFLAPSVRIEF
jgi:hypothetical protein